ncbi:MAG TPA: tetratricopeptide repeat protein [Luteolibacter sp.]
MKTRLFLLSCALLAAQASFAEPIPKPSPEVFYQKGVKAVEAGDVAEAKSNFEQALQLDPNHANARYQLAELQRNAGRIAAKGREGKLSSVIIPSLEFRAADLNDALTALGQMVEKESKGAVTLNFIVDDPGAKLAPQKVTLQLKNIPAKSALDYLLTQVGAKARFDEHAVVITPR